MKMQNMSEMGSLLDRRNIAIYIAAITLIVNAVALFQINDTIQQNSTIVENLSEQLSLERAQLVKSYSNFKQDFTVTVHSFYPERDVVPAIPIDIENLAIYRTTGTIWITPGEVCILHQPGVLTAGELGQSYDVETKKSRSITVPLIKEYVSQIDDIDSFIVKLTVQSMPYDVSVGHIDELESTKYMWIEFDHEKSLGKLYPIHVSDEKIECNEYIHFNQNAIISSDHEWVYSYDILRSAG